MGLVLSGKTHYLHFKYATTGIARPDWTVTIFQDGRLRDDIPYNIDEPNPGIYVLSFKNTGGHYEQWTAIIAPTASLTDEFTGNWDVVKPIAEQASNEARTRINVGASELFSSQNR